MDIRCTERTEGLARLRITADNAAEIDGSVRGPFCSYSRTLPCTYKICKGKAWIVDPCYWSPTLPFRYEVNLDIEFQNGNKDQHQFLWGLRSCIPHKYDLRLNGKRYVVRAVQAEPERADLMQLRNASALLMTAADNVALLEEASEIGVMVIVVDNSPSRESYRRLNLLPAVHFVKNCYPADVTGDLLRIASEPSLNPSSEVLWMKELDVSRHSEYSKPTFAARSINSANTADMRKACDQLQRDMAKYGQFAGYVIHSGDLF